MAEASWALPNRATARRARARLQSTRSSPDGKQIAALREVSQLLDSKAPADSVRFKTWLHHIAENAAEASAEGVFMGFGGTQVSDAEKATLAELSRALGIAA